MKLVLLKVNDQMAIRSGYHVSAKVCECRNCEAKAVGAASEANAVGAASESWLSAVQSGICGYGASLVCMAITATHELLGAKIWNRTRRALLSSTGPTVSHWFKRNS